MYSLKCLWRLHSAEEHLKNRTVVPSSTEDKELSELLKLYKDNRIRTTKYSVLSFLPKNLFEQLHRFANIYFIFLAALNFIPVVEAFQPEVALIPIIVVLTVTACKDLWEDYSRFKSDRLINKRPCHVYSRWARLQSYFELVNQNICSLLPGLRSDGVKTWNRSHVFLFSPFHMFLRFTNLNSSKVLIHDVLIMCAEFVQMKLWRQKLKFSKKETKKQKISQTLFIEQLWDDQGAAQKRTQTGSQS